MKVAVKQKYIIPLSHAAAWAVASAVDGGLIHVVTETQRGARELLNQAGDIALGRHQVRRITRTQGMESIEFLGGGRVTFSANAKRTTRGEDWLILHVGAS